MLEGPQLRQLIRKVGREETLKAVLEGLTPFDQARLLQGHVGLDVRSLSVSALDLNRVHNAQLYAYLNHPVEARGPFPSAWSKLNMNVEQVTLHTTELTIEVAVDGRTPP